MGLTGAGSGAYAQEGEFTSGNTGIVPSVPPAPVSFSTGTAGSGSSVTVNAPASIAAGNLLVAVYSVGTGTANTFTPPTGWTQVANHSGSGVAFGTLIATKTATGSEPTSYTFSQLAGAGQSVTVGQYKGVSSVDVDGFADSVAGSSTASTPSVTPAKSGEMLAAVFVTSINTFLSTPTSPAGLTLESTISGGTAPNSIWCDEIYNSTAATGAISSNLSVSHAWMALAMFLK